MDKNNTSSFSVCTKIRQALASNPAVQAIQRISSFNQEPKHVTTAGSNSPSSPAKTSSTIQTKPPLPPHHKAHTETSGAIPIKFDHSTPIENGNSAVSSGAAKGAPALVGNSERGTKVATKGTEPRPQYQYVPMQGKPPTKAGAQAQHGHGVHSEQQGKKSMDINETFDDFIKRVKDKMRTVSNIGRGQGNPAAAPDHEVHGASKNENHKDHYFLDYINRAKKKIRTTTTVGKTGSLRRE